VPASEYYVKQAELAARLALVESDPEKARAMHILALEHYDKPDKANTKEAPTSTTATRDIGAVNCVHFTQGR
jgi:hypothetical protein